MAKDTSESVFLAPGEGAAVKNPVGGPLTFKIRGAQTNGALTAFESVAAPGEGPPLHLHEHEDEIWYALEGTFRMNLNAICERHRRAPSSSSRRESYTRGRTSVTSQHGSSQSSPRQGSTTSSSGSQPYPLMRRRRRNSADWVRRSA